MNIINGISGIAEIVRNCWKSQKYNLSAIPESNLYFAEVYLLLLTFILSILK